MVPGERHGRLKAGTRLPCFYLYAYMTGEALFCKWDRSTWARAEHFDYYYHQIRCRYTLGAEMDVTELVSAHRSRGSRFYALFLYAVLRVVNEMPEFRMAFDGEGNPGYWNFVNPSFTVFHPDDRTFSDVWSEWDEDFSSFERNMEQAIARYGRVKGVKARPHTPPNFCPVSSIPWLSYTTFSQDTYGESSFLLPLIKFGRYVSREGRVMMPFSVFVHHAAADGYHTCALINAIQELALYPGRWLGS